MNDARVTVLNNAHKAVVEMFGHDNIVPGYKLDPNGTVDENPYSFHVELFKGGEEVDISVMMAPQGMIEVYISEKLIRDQLRPDVQRQALLWTVMPFKEDDREKTFRIEMPDENGNIRMRFSSDLQETSTYLEKILFAAIGMSDVEDDNDQEEGPGMETENQEEGQEEGPGMETENQEEGQEEGPGMETENQEGAQEEGPGMETENQEGAQEEGPRMEAGNQEGAQEEGPRMEAGNQEEGQEEGPGMKAGNQENGVIVVEGPEQHYVFSGDELEIRGEAREQQEDPIIVDDD
jgi:hypothetical protein